MSDTQNQLAFDFPVVVSQSNESGYLLLQLEVYNWGPFRGLHRAEFDRDGTAIIGPTGSGKTTLVDALMTLLVPQPRYNLASTGGHESDRDLISYVRGVLGGDGADGREEVARPGKTITGICATYQQGEDVLRLGGLLWTDGPSNAAQDLKRRWCFSQAEDQSLEKWLRILHEDGVRDLMKLGRETAKFRIFENKKPYLTHTRKFFDVGENAFTLLNRAAGLKQLNSIDEIFRDLVLDDRSAFDRAIEVAEEFDNLAGIHAELEIARRQQESLVPLAEEYRKLQNSRIKVQHLEVLKRIVPVWFAMASERLWSQELKQIETEKESVQSQRDLLIQKEIECRSRVEAFHERYLKLGGNVIGELEKTIQSQEILVTERTRYANDYKRMVSAFSLSEELSIAALKSNQKALTEKREETQQKRETKEEVTFTAISLMRDSELKMNEVESLLQKVKERPGSNIPPMFQDFRTDLANELNLHDSDLPFLAELVEVKPEQSEWRGAIERAIGSERLRILVPDNLLHKGLQWINHRDNRLHVRLQQASKSDQPGTSFPDGFVRKLNFKSHPLASTARKLISSRDLHCVNSTESLRQTEHGLTIEGMISGQRGKFEKQDQRRLNENWMTGFDNKDQLEALANELILLRTLVLQQQAGSKAHRHELAELDSQLSIIDQLLKLEYSTIDLPGAESDLAYSNERLILLLDPKSDSSLAKSEFDTQRKKLDSILKDISESESKIAVLVHKDTHAIKERAKVAKRIGNGLSEEETALAERKLPIGPGVQASQLDDMERNAAKDASDKLEKQHEQVSVHENRLVRLMEAALRVDTGALVNTGSELDDINDYLERLRILNEEALPEKLNRFLAYLNSSSDQGVTQLLSGITEEVDAIEQRINELNQTLVKVDFRSGRYLQLQPQRIKNERLRSLDIALRKLRDAVFKDDQGESHYKALRDLVDILRDAGQNRRQLGSRALLDPRYRLQFFVVEVDRKTGSKSPPRTGSQSGSGGEKELMASHILTASLSYALCPAETTYPLYGTVVLDEAFSKSSPSAASRIIEALRIFRLHPIFVTPNKEIGLLKQHTRKVICVQRPKKEASLASISWETLEELANP
ncbi:MAG TPA: hypothetical protein DD473_15370 [Planctomycetaceae bacterium]|nr:hypothetical protein [Planctomycetaceae bacterium]